MDVNKLLSFPNSPFSRRPAIQAAEQAVYPLHNIVNTCNLPYTSQDEIKCGLNRGWGVAMTVKTRTLRQNVLAWPGHLVLKMPLACATCGLCIMVIDLKYGLSGEGSKP